MGPEGERRPSLPKVESWGWRSSWAKGRSTVHPRVPKGHSKSSSVQWPLSVSEGTVSKVSGELHFRFSGKIARPVGEGDSLLVELGARFRLLEQLQVLAHQAACLECVGPQWLGLQRMPGRHAWLPRCGSGLEEIALHAFYYCERVRSFWSHVKEWMARISPRELVLLNFGYVVDNVDPPFQGEKRVILAVARMVIWQTQNKGLYEGANFSYCDLILFFRHQLKVKIRCDRKGLDRTTFSKRWVHAASLVVCKGATLKSSFPSLPTHGDNGPGLLGPHPG